MSTAQDQSATANQTDTTKNETGTTATSTTSTTTTSISGDNKGEQQTITSKDVGDLGAVLGTTAVESQPAAPVAVTTTQRTEVQPPVAKAAVVQAPVAKPAASAPEVKKTVSTGVTVTDTSAVADEQLPEVLEALKVGKMQSNHAMLDILSYVSDMHPAKPQGAASIEANQIKLLNALYTIVISEDTNFAPVFKGVIAIVRRHRNDCFKVTMRNRGLNSVSMASIDNKNMRFLTRLVDTLFVASGLKDMSTVKQHVDMKKLFETVANVRAKQNLTAFFS
ncbi:MAG TPA: hypothetical protein VF905_06335 [Nitrospirota bacterium]